MKTDSCRHHSNNFTIACQFGCKENHRDKYEQRTEHIGVVGNKRQVIVKYNLFGRHLVLKEIIHFLRQVEDNGNAQNQYNREKECT